MSTQRTIIRPEATGPYSPGLVVDGLVFLSRYFERPRPVRTTVRADLVDGMLVEITVVARLE